MTVEYSNYFVAFLDVLGFSDFVVKSKNDQESMQKISGFNEQVRQAFRVFDSLKSKESLFRVAVSDSVVLAIPVEANGGKKVQNLRKLCMAIRAIQWSMANRNIWMRGAVSIGDCWVDKETSQIVGPAFITAYSLEKNAKFPRVILDPAIIPRLDFKSRNEAIISINNSDEQTKNGNCIFDWEQYYHGQTINAFTDDVALFIDFLSLGFREGQEDSAINVYNYICSSLFHFQTYEKFVWLKEYFKNVTAANCGADHKISRHINENP